MCNLLYYCDMTSPRANITAYFLACPVGILANTPGVVQRSGLGAHAYWVISRVLKLF